MKRNSNRGGGSKKRPLPVLFANDPRHGPRAASPPAAVPQGGDAFLRGAPHPTIPTSPIRQAYENKEIDAAANRAEAAIGSQAQDVARSVNKLILALSSIPQTNMEEIKQKVGTKCDEWYASSEGSTVSRLANAGAKEGSPDESIVHAILTSAETNVDGESPFDGYVDDEAAPKTQVVSYKHAGAKGSPMYGKDPSKVLNPNRVHAAISAEVLNRAAEKLDHIGLMKTLAAQLLDYVYDKNGQATQLDCFERRLETMPYFEKVSMLRLHVNKLVEERTILELEELKLARRRVFRTRMIMRSIAYRSQSILCLHFSHWSAHVKLTLAQRAALIRRLTKMREYPLKILFPAWRAAAVKLKLQELDRTAIEINLEISNLQNDLTEAERLEAKLTDSVNKLTEEESLLRKQLADTKLAIERQRVPETFEVIKSVCEAAMMMGNTAVDVIEPLIEQIEESPSYHKIAQVYWSVREEEQNADKEAALMEHEANQRAKYDSLEEKRKKREEKLRKRELAKCEKEKKVVMEEARLMGEQAYKDNVDENNKFKKDEMDAAGVKAANVAGKKIDDRYKAWIKDRDKAEAERKRILKEEQARMARENEVAFRAKQREEELNGRMAEEDIMEGLIELGKLNPDEILLRWMKYHLRRTCWKGYQFRRKVENYRTDLRDGTAYLVLFKRIQGPIAPPGYEPLWPKDGKFNYVEDSVNFDGKQTKKKVSSDIEYEIDPNVRLEMITTLAAQIEPAAASGFITGGHILGNDTFLNAGFTSRLMLTCHGLQADVGEGTDVFKARQRFEKVRTEWAEACAAIAKFAVWDDWVEVRREKDDAALATLFTTLADCADELGSLLISLQPLARTAERGRKEWAALKAHVERFQWDVFGVKVLQEEEAPQGVDIDVAEGHAPFKLVDHKFDRKFKCYTELHRGRLRALLDETVFEDNRSEAQWKKEEEVIAKAAEEKRPVDPEELPLTEEEIEEVRAATVPLTDEEFDEYHREYERLLRVNYDDVSKVFKFYAAGGEGGRSDGLSSTEWWGVCNDILIVGGKDPRANLDKSEVDEVFNATETPEEIEERAAEKARREANKAAADDMLIGEGATAEEMTDTPEEAAAEAKKKEEEEEEEEYAWELDEDERELGPAQWVDVLVRLGLKKFKGNMEGKNVPFTERLNKVIQDFLVPNAGKSNTETFRGELSLDEVQAVFKKFKPQIMAIFMFYAREHPTIPGQPLREPSMNGPGYLRMLKDSKIVTRQGDLRHDFPELQARKVFQDSQMEEEGANSIDTGGGDEEMIYMEYIEVWAAISSYKFPNPYIPLQKKVEDMFANIVFPNQQQFALKGKGKKGKKK